MRRNHSGGSGRQLTNQAAAVTALAVAMLATAGCYTTHFPGTEATRLRSLATERTVLLEHGLTATTVGRDTGLTLVTTSGERLEMRPRDAAYSSRALRIDRGLSAGRTVPFESIARVDVHRLQPARFAFDVVLGVIYVAGVAAGAATLFAVW